MSQIRDMLIILVIMFGALEFVAHNGWKGTFQAFRDHSDESLMNRKFHRCLKWEKK